MNNLSIKSVFILITLLVVAGGTTIKALSVMNSGRLTSDQIEESVIPLDLRGGHVIVVPVRINNSDMVYDFSKAGRSSSYPGLRSHKE